MPVQADRQSVVVIAATGAASPSMNCMRDAGSRRVDRQIAAPVFSTAKIDTIASAERDNSSATRSPGPAP